MCFRPAGVEINLNCPDCGKKLPVIGNTVLEKCPFCKYEFTEQDMQDFQNQLTGGAAGAGAPGAPAAPGAPGAPAAPGAPGAPKAPGM